MHPGLDTNVLIVGGGIAGLALAIALRFYRIEHLLLERVADVHKAQGGSGLRLGYNAGRAFAHLGLLDDAIRIGSPLEGVRFETDAGRSLGNTNHVEGETHLGTRRPPLHEFLLGAADGERVQTGAEFARFEQDADGVTAHLADGRTVRGSVLVGADGLRSVVREQIHDDGEPRYAGYSARRGVVRADVPGEMRVILGEGKRFAYFPVGDGWVYWSASTNEPAGGKETPEELKRTVLERFGGWPDPVEQFVADTDDSDTFRADTYDRNPIRRWGEGRVTLLGDAASPMTWDQGQGACQGIEGAVLLAKRLSDDGGDQVATLRSWEDDRARRTKRVVLGSRRMGKLCQSENPAVRAFRNRAVTALAGSKKESAHHLVDF